MKVVTGTICLVVALTLTVTAGAFAQMTPQAEGNTNSQVTNTKSVNGKTLPNPTSSTNPTTSTDPKASTSPTTSTNPTTSTQDPTTPTKTSTPAAGTTSVKDCASEIAGMNTVLKAIPPQKRTSWGEAGRLPDVPCA